MATSRQRIQLRRDTAANWTAANPVLLAGEAGVETDSGRLKIGNGTQQWTDLEYLAGDAANGLPTGGDPGNVLLKSSYDNYDSSWVATIDGGTFN